MDDFCDVRAHDGESSDLGVVNGSEFGISVDFAVWEIAAVAVVVVTAIV